MTESEQIRTLARRFFDAIEQGDIDTVVHSFTPDAQIWHNTDELIVSREQTGQVLTAMHGRINNPRFEDRRLETFPGGFVQQHVLVGERVLDGATVRLPCCIVCRTEGRQIARLDEYFDSAHVAEFRKAEFRKSAAD